MCSCVRCATARSATQDERKGTVYLRTNIHVKYLEKSDWKWSVQPDLRPSLSPSLAAVNPDTAQALLGVPSPPKPSSAFCHRPGPSRRSRRCPGPTRRSVTTQALLGVLSPPRPASAFRRRRFCRRHVTGCRRRGRLGGPRAPPDSTSGRRRRIRRAPARRRRESSGRRDARRKSPRRWRSFSVQRRHVPSPSCCYTAGQHCMRQAQAGVFRSVARGGGDFGVFRPSWATLCTYAGEIYRRGVDQRSIRSTNAR